MQLAARVAIIDSSEACGHLLDTGLSNNTGCDQINLPSMLDFPGYPGKLLICGAFRHQLGGEFNTTT